MNSFESGIWILFGSLIRFVFHYFPHFLLLPRGQFLGPTLFVQMTSLTQPGVLHCIWISLGLSLCKNALGGVLTAKTC